MTPSTCFLCNTVINVESSLLHGYNRRKINLAKRFCVLVCRYLNKDCQIFHPQETLNVDECQEDEIFLDKYVMRRDSKFLCCSENCFSAIESFCDDFEKWKRLDLMLSWKLKGISELMDDNKEGNENEPKFSSFNNQKECQIKKFKDLLKVEAKAKWTADPHLSLENIPIQIPTYGTVQFVKVEVPDEAPSSLETSYNDTSMEEAVFRSDVTTNVDSMGNIFTVEMKIESDLVEMKETFPDLETVYVPIPPSTTNRTVRVVKSKPFQCQRQHPVANGFPCKYCGKNFYHRNYRDNHERIHEGNPAFSCQFCGRGFTLERSKRNHERIHTGEKPYECKHCAKTFARSEGLVIHIRTHTGERPFKCQICGKRFTQSIARRTHIKTVHEGVRPVKKNTLGVKSAGTGQEIKPTVPKHYRARK